MLFLIATTISLVSHFERVVGVCNTRVGGPLNLFPTGSGDGICLSPTARERMAMVFDGNLTTKHVNFGIGDSQVFAHNKGAGTGFVFRFPILKPVVLQAFQFGTGNGKPACDPITITIEGIAFTDFFSPVPDSEWKLVYNGSTGIDNNNDPGRNVYGKQQIIVEGSSYGAYRVLIASQRGLANTVQYSEVQLFGYFV